MSIQFTSMQDNGNGQIEDYQIIAEYRKEKEGYFNLFRNIYCYLIHSGYIPRRWAEFQIPEKDYINITIDHKTLN